MASRGRGRHRSNLMKGRMAGRFVGWCIFGAHEGRTRILHEVVKGCEGLNLSLDFSLVCQLILDVLELCLVLIATLHRVGLHQGLWSRICV